MDAITCNSIGRGVGCWWLWEGKDRNGGLCGLSFLHTFHSLAPNHAPKKQCHACFVPSSARLALPLVGMIPIYSRVRIKLALSVVLIDSAGLATKSMGSWTKMEIPRTTFMATMDRNHLFGKPSLALLQRHRWIKFLRNKFSYNSFD